MDHVDTIIEFLVIFIYEYVEGISYISGVKGDKLGLGVIFIKLSLGSAGKRRGGLARSASYSAPRRKEMGRIVAPNDDAPTQLGGLLLTP